VLDAVERSDWWWVVLSWSTTGYRLQEAVDIHRSPAAERTAESLACRGGGDAFDGGMHPSASAGKDCGLVRDHLAVSRDHPQ